MTRLRDREPVLRLEGLTKRFGGVRALSEVDLDVHSHEVVAVVGLNGAGKSTLVEAVAGVVAPDSGRVLIDGRPVPLGDPAQARRHGVAAVFQDRALCENLDVVANLFLGQERRRLLRLDEVAMEQASWSLLRGLGATLPSLRVPVDSLTGGQQQVVAVARALLGAPRVLLLDEPTASLGVAQAAQVLTAVGALRDQGHAVVFASRSIPDVLAVADRVLVLRLGRPNGIHDVAGLRQEDLLAEMTGARPQEAAP